MNKFFIFIVFTALTNCVLSNTRTIRQLQPNDDLRSLFTQNYFPPHVYNRPMALAYQHYLSNSPYNTYSQMYQPNYPYIPTEIIDVDENGQVLRKKPKWKITKTSESFSSGNYQNKDGVIRIATTKPVVIKISRSLDPNAKTNFISYNVVNGKIVEPTTEIITPSTVDDKISSIKPVI